MGRTKQEKKICKTETEPVLQKILRQSIKKEESHESNVQQSESQQKQVQKRGRKKKVCQDIQFKNCQDNSQYLQESNLTNPNNLKEQVFKIIISCGNSAKLSAIIKKLQYYYEKEISLQIFYEFLAEQEEMGSIFEIQGQYKITSEFLKEQTKNQLQWHDGNQDLYLFQLNKSCEECSRLKVN